jgi:hypothetical protein
LDCYLPALEIAGGWQKGDRVYICDEGPCMYVYDEVNGIITKGAEGTVVGAGDPWTERVRVDFGSSIGIKGVRSQHVLAVPRCGVKCGVVCGEVWCRVV